MSPKNKEPMNRTLKGIMIAVATTLIATAIATGTNEVIKAFKHKANAEDVKIAVEIMQQQLQSERELSEAKLQAQKELAEKILDAHKEATKEELKNHKEVEQEKHQAQQKDIERLYKTNEALLKQLIEMNKP